MYTSPDQADKYLTVVCERFPEWTQVILKLTANDEKFKDACENYCLAVEALANFGQRPDRERPHIVAEYTSLVAECWGQTLFRFIDTAAEER